MIIDLLEQFSIIIFFEELRQTASKHLQQS